MFFSNDLSLTVVIKWKTSNANFYILTHFLYFNYSAGSVLPCPIAVVIMTSDDSHTKAVKIYSRLVRQENYYFP